MSFTCLEMADSNVPPQYSQAHTLVGWVGAEAGRIGILLRGENALAGDVTQDSGWDQIQDIFDHFPYTSFTALRVGEVTQGIGEVRYRQFIRTYRGLPSLYIRGTNNNWGLTAMQQVGKVWAARNIGFGDAPGQSFKFCVYPDWSVNFGGTGCSGNAIGNGPNIPVMSGGTYDITFDETTQIYTATEVNTSAGASRGQKAEKHGNTAQDKGIRASSN